MRLRTFLFIAFVGIAIVPVGALAAWVYFHILEREVARVDDTHLLLAKNLSSGLDQYAHDVKSTYKVVFDMALAGQDLTVIQEMMQDLNFNHLCAADLKSRKVVLEVAPTALPCPKVVPERRFKTFMAQARTGEIVFSPVLKDPQKRPTIYLLEVRGNLLLIGAISTNHVVEQGKSIAFGERGHAAIVDHTGRLIAHPLPKWREEIKNLAKLEPVQRMMKGETGTTRFFSPALKADMIAGYTTVPSSRWGVMIPQPYAEIETSARAAQTWAIVISLLGALAAAALSWLLSGLVASRVDRIIAASTRMSSGDLETRIEIDEKRDPKEFSAVAHAFNGMAESLAQRNREISEALTAAEESAREKEALALEAQQANVAKSSFLSAMSHELRTPLNSVIGFAQLLGTKHESTDDGEEAEAVRNILNSGLHLLDLVDDVLDLAKIESQQVDLSLEPVNVKQVMDEALRVIKPLADRNMINLNDADITAETFVRSDFTRCKQVLLNLLSNAVKYNHPGGSITISVEPVDNTWIRIAVSDTGMGISPEFTSKVFAPFERWQADRNTIEGTGIGLSICRKLIDSMQGRIDFISTPGVGSKFWFDLPQADNNKSPQPKPVASVNAANTSAEMAARVLYIEDNPANLKLMQLVVGQVDGVELLAATCGLQGIDVARAEQPNLILLDIHLPDINGHEVLAQLRATQETKDIPVVALSANAMEHDIKTAMESGFDHYLTKPINIEEVIETLYHPPVRALPCTNFQ